MTDEQLRVESDRILRTLGLDLDEDLGDLERPRPAPTRPGDPSTDETGG